MEGVRPKESGQYFRPSSAVGFPWVFHTNPPKLRARRPREGGASDFRSDAKATSLGFPRASERRHSSTWMDCVPRLCLSLGTRDSAGTVRSVALSVLSAASEELGGVSVGWSKV